MQAAQNGRELETLAFLSHKSMAELTQLGIIMPCLAFTDVLHVDEVWLSLPMPSTDSFPNVLNSTGILLWCLEVRHGAQHNSERPASLALSGSSPFLEKASLCPLPSGTLRPLLTEAITAQGWSQGT